MSLSHVLLLQVVVSFVIAKWMSMVIMRFAATTELRFCFVTTAFATSFLGHAARAAGLSAVVIEKKNQVEGSNAKPGDITVQHYHRGFASSAFDITISHPLQKKYLDIAMAEAGVVAEEAHDMKSLEVCQREGIHFVPLAWESTGGATQTLHETIRKWTEMESARSGYPAYLIRRNLYSQVSVRALEELSSSWIDRRVEFRCERVL